MMNFSKIEDRLEGAIALTLCALIGLLPVSIALVESLSGVAIFLYLIKKAFAARQQVLKTGPNGGYWHVWLSKIFESRTYLHKPLLMLTFIIFVSVLFSQYRVLSLIAFIAKTLQGVFLFLVVTDNLKKRWHLTAFIVSFLAIVLLVSLSAIVQLQTGVDFLRGVLSDKIRSSACFRHPNDLGAFLVIALSLCSGVVIALKKWSSKIIAGMLLGLIGVAFLLTFSRSSWLGFIVSMIIFLSLRPKYWLFILSTFLVFVLVFFPKLSEKRQIGFLVSAVSLINQKEDHQQLAHVSVLKPAISDPANPGYHMTSRHPFVQNTLNLVRRFSVDGRTDYWVKAINIIDSAPVVGTGLNTYAKVESRYPAFWGGGYPHNCYLQMTAETGLLGVSFFMWFIACLFIRTLKSLKKMQDEQLKVLVICLLSGLAGFLVQSFFDTTLYSVQLGNFLWIIIGLVVAAVQIDRHMPVIDKK